MLGMVARVFRRLSLGQPADKENANYKRDCDELAGKTIHTRHQTLLKAPHPKVITATK
jgi:hypothetical protein